MTCLLIAYVFIASVLFMAMLHEYPLKLGWSLVVSSLVVALMWPVLLLILTAGGLFRSIESLINRWRQ